MPPPVKLVSHALASIYSVGERGVLEVIPKTLRNLLVLPFVAAVVSFGVILLKALVSRIFRPPSQAEIEDEQVDQQQSNERPRNPWGVLSRHVKNSGGVLSFSYQMARFISGLALLVLNLITPSERVTPEGVLVEQHGSGLQIGVLSGVSLTDAQILKLSFGAVYFYTTFLSLLAAFGSKTWSRTAARHATMIYFLTFSIFAYRDLYPLATIHAHPKDGAEGTLLWFKVAILFLVGVVIPLVMPREYVPVDPKNPMEPNPEQTASLLSFATYSFLDPLILLAYRLPHLSLDKLPPLADYDHAHNLKANSFKHLDKFSGARQRHIFWGFTKVFWFEYSLMAVSIGLMAACSFVSPVSIKYLLGYLETNGGDAIIKPWVWIVGLFVGPVSASMFYQSYLFFATQALVRCEAIVTQLIFEHALRIRIKAETENVKEDQPTTLPEGSQASVAGDTEGSTATEPVSTEGDSEHTRDDTTTSTYVPSTSEGTVRPTSPGGKSTSSSQSKQNKVKDPKVEEASAQKSATSNLVGRLNNLVTTDLANITGAKDVLFVLVYIPMQILLCTVFLYLILGWSAFVGLAVMVILFPIPGWVTQKIQQIQKIRMKKTDARVQTVTEAMNVIRMIKLFGWEKKMEEKIAKKREDELLSQWKRQIYELINGNINFIIPVFVMVATYFTYTVIMGQQLKASIVFSSMTVFDILRDQLFIVAFMLNQIISGKVSLDRVNDFLKDTELLDPYVNDTLNPFFARPDTDNENIGFRESSFTWSVDTDGTLTPSKRNYMLKIDGEVLFSRGRLNLIVGPTGAGKTSVLMALLGEMHYVPNGPNSWFNLPRKGGVAYAAQESWVQNETIKDNILFGYPYDEERYRKVIYQCGLERDLELLEAGDQTEVGEKGLTLSGGQKARVTLARAIYSSAQILLLDDILAALDVHTAKWVVDKCFAGDLVKGRTVILVTHNVALIRPLAEFAISIGTDGSIVAQGTVLEVLGADETIVETLKRDEEVIEMTEEQVDNPTAPKSEGRLIVAEEVEVGHIGWPSLKHFLIGLGGNHPALFFLAFLGGLFVTELGTTFQTWYLGYWAAQYEDHPASEVSVPHYLGTYATLVIVGVAFYMFAYATFIYGILRASRYLHNKLIGSVFGTTLRWLDTTPVSRIITRCTQDIRAADGPFKDGLKWLIEISIAMITKLAAIVLMTPAFLIPGFTVGLFGGWIGHVYMSAQLSVKREMSNAKAPVVGHFGAAVAGLTSIRAYEVEERFIQESMNRINRYTGAGRAVYNLNRWVCIRLDVIGALFAAGLGAYLVYFQNQSASDVGFSLNMAIGFSSMILYWVRSLNLLEVEGNSIERIWGYTIIEQESKPTTEGVPPAYWPASGSLVVDKLSARYSQNGPKVLHDISFKVNSGERVGVVGRTGSGKSSLTLALLRCILTEGEVFYDGIKTSDINLDALRSKITIIPQIPEMLSGTLRHNLDPFEQYDDATLNDALRTAGLFALQADMDEDKITLDTQISSGGGNLSVGQRQILALARAVVRGSKVLILDEATSAIDHKTDTAIQSSLRHELDRGTTVITIAHRLQTIMDADKIIVLDAGRIVEFDSPVNLLKNEKGFLHSLVEESGEKDHLYEMAEGSRSLVL